MTSSPSIRLRPVIESDLAVFLEHRRDAAARQMAAFASKDAPDAAAFMAHWTKLLADPTVVSRTIMVDGVVAGHVAKWERDGVTEVTYWLGREHWGRGHATRALAAFLAEYTDRPLHAGVASDNVASRRVLEKCGFIPCGAELSQADARGREIDELMLKLE